MMVAREPDAHPSCLPFDEPTDGEAVDHFAGIILESRFERDSADRHTEPSVISRRSCASVSSDGFVMDQALANVCNYWANGNPVAIDVTLAAAAETDDGSGMPGETLLESWVLELTPLFSIEMGKDRCMSPPELTVSPVESGEVDKKLLELALKSFLHFSPLNSWLLKDPDARSRLRYHLRDPTAVAAAQAAAPPNRKRFAPLQLSQSQLLLEVHFQTASPGLPWLRIAKSKAGPVAPRRTSSRGSLHRDDDEVSPPPEKRERPRYFDAVPPRDPPPLRRASPTPLPPTDMAVDDTGCQHLTVREEGRRAAATGFFSDPLTEGRIAESPDPRRRRRPASVCRSPDEDEAALPEESPGTPPRSAPIPISPVKGGGGGGGGSGSGLRGSRLSSPPRSSWARSLSGGASVGSVGSVGSSMGSSRGPSFSRGRLLGASPHGGLGGKAFGSRPSSLVSRNSSLEHSMFATMASRRLLGSFEESLLSGRMSHSASAAVKGFMVEIGACGAGKTPKHIKFDLPASFYKPPGESSPSPYVGKVQLDGDRELLPTGRYRVPTHGLIQVMINNPEKTGVKVFLVKYDFRDMPKKSRTFLRQRTFVETEDRDADGERRRRLLYAIHLRFVSTKAGRVYLHQDIRVVFTHRAPDSSENIKTITEGPSNPVYSPCAVDPEPRERRPAKDRAATTAVDAKVRAAKLARAQGRQAGEMAESIRHPLGLLAKLGLE